MIKDSFGVRIYAVKAEDFHWPNTWMRESGTPAAAAVVAAPMRKLCPLKPPTSMLWGRRASLTACTKAERVRGSHSGKQKGDPVRFLEAQCMPGAPSQGRLIHPPTQDRWWIPRQRCRLYSDAGIRRHTTG